MVNSIPTLDKSQIADRLGMLTVAGNPHAYAVGAIIAQLDIDDSEWEVVPYHRNGYDSVDYQFTESVVEKVRAWLKAHSYPASIPAADGKSYNVRYRAPLSI